MCEEFFLSKDCLLLIWINWSKTRGLHKLISCECRGYNRQHQYKGHHLPTKMDLACLLKQSLLDIVEVHELFVCLFKFFSLSNIEVLSFVYHFDNFSFHVWDDFKNLFYLINILKSTNLSIAWKRSNVVFLINVIVEPHLCSVREVSHIEAYCLLIVWLLSLCVDWHSYFVVEVWSKAF